MSPQICIRPIAVCSHQAGSLGARRTKAKQARRHAKDSRKLGDIRMVAMEPRKTWYLLACLPTYFEIHFAASAAASGPCSLQTDVKELLHRSRGPLQLVFALDGSKWAGPYLVTTMSQAEVTVSSCSTSEASAIDFSGCRSFNLTSRYSRNRCPDY